MDNYFDNHRNRTPSLSSSCSSHTSYESTSPSSTSGDQPSGPGLLAYAVQSVCGTLDHEGHTKAIEELQTEKSSLEKQVERLQARLDQRVQWATPEYYHDHMRFAQQAKRREEARNEVLLEKIAILQEELSDNILLPVMLENEVKALKIGLEAASASLEVERKKHLEEKDSHKDTAQKLKEAQSMLQKQKVNLQDCKMKLDQTARLVDQVASDKAKLREDGWMIKNELDVARTATADAERRLKMAEEDITNYRASVEGEWSAQWDKHSELVTSLRDAVAAADTKLKDVTLEKDKEIERMSSAASEAKQEVSNIREALSKVSRSEELASAKIKAMNTDLEEKNNELQRLASAATEAKQEVLDLRCALNTVSRSEELANARIEVMGSDMKEKDNEIQQLVRAAAEAKQELSNVTCALNMVRQSEELANARTEELEKDLQTRNQEMESLQHVLHTAFVTTSNNLRGKIEKKDAKIHQLSTMLTTANQEISGLENSLKKGGASKATIDETIWGMRKEIVDRDERIQQLRSALIPKAAQGQALHGLWSRVTDQQRTIGCQNKQIRDLERVIRVIRKETVAAPPPCEDQVTALTETNVQQAIKILELDGKYSEALAKIDDLAATAKETERNLALVNEKLMERLHAQEVQAHDAFITLAASEKMVAELEERANALDQRDTALLVEKKLLEDEVRKETASGNQLGLKLFKVAKETSRLREKLSDTERSRNMISLTCQTKEQVIITIASERNALKNQLMTERASAWNLKILNSTLNQQVQSLTVELLEENGKLNQAEAAGESTITRLTNDIDGLQNQRSSMLRQISLLERKDTASAQQIEKLCGRANEALYRLESVVVEYTASTAKGKELEKLIVDRDVTIEDLNHQLHEASVSALAFDATTGQQQESQTKEGNSLATGNVDIDMGAPKLTGKLDFAQRRLVFEELRQHKPVLRTTTKSIPIRSSHVRNIIQKIEDRHETLPLNGRGSTNAQTRVAERTDAPLLSPLAIQHPRGEKWIIEYPKEQSSEEQCLRSTKEVDQVSSLELSVEEFDSKGLKVMIGGGSICGRTEDDERYSEGDEEEYDVIHVDDALPGRSVGSQGGSAVSPSTRDTGKDRKKKRHMFGLKGISKFMKKHL